MKEKKKSCTVSCWRLNTCLPRPEIVPPLLAIAHILAALGRDGGDLKISISNPLCSRHLPAACACASANAASFSALARLCLVSPVCVTAFSAQIDLPGFIQTYSGQHWTVHVPADAKALWSRAC